MKDGMRGKHTEGNFAAVALVVVTAIMAVMTFLNW